MAEERRKPGKGCTLCNDPRRRAFVDEHLRLGKSANAIEALSRAPAASDMGLSPIKYETIRRHLRHEDEFVQAVPEAERMVVEQPPEATYERVPEGPVKMTVDVAALVAEKAAAGIADGSLRVTTAHGLQAQRMLDARLDKRRDRELAISLAKMLSGQSMVPGRLIVRNVTPTQTADDDFAPALSDGDG